MTVELRWGSVSDKGRVRPANEDNLLVAEPLFVVADGMGGHAAGEVASRMAIETLEQAFGPDHPPTIEAVVAAVRQANRDIIRQSLDMPDLRGMGTTVTGLAFLSTDGGATPATRVAVFNVGDSRTYLYRGGQLRRVTTDHSYVQSLVDAGEITLDEARIHPHRNIVTRALGVDADVDVDLVTETPEPGDRWVLCSDGLVDELDDDEIERVLVTTVDSQAAADELTRRANASGGRDNITVIVVDVLEGADVDGAAVAAPPPETGESAAVGGWLGDDASELDTTTPVPEPTSPPDPADAAAATAATSAAAEAAAAPKRKRRPALATVVIVVAVLAVLGAAFGAIQLYGRAGYYLAFSGEDVVVYQGRPGGVLWIDPTLAGTYPLTRDELTPAGQTRIDSNPTFSSRSAADTYVQNLTDDPAAVIPPTTTTTSTTTTSTTTTTTTLPPTTVAPPAPPDTVSPSPPAT